MGSTETMKLSCLFSVALAEVTRFDGDKVYKFKNLTNGQIQHLKTYDRAQGGFDFWKPDYAENLLPGMDADIHVSAHQVADFEAQLREFEIDATVMHSNLQYDIDMGRLTLNRAGKAHSFTNYNDFDTIMTYVKDVADTYDDVVYLEYGESIEGRKLMALEIGTGPKVIQIDCGFHAREWISPAYCNWFINEAVDGRFKKYTNDVKFLVLPIINPDGYVFSWTDNRMWRKNRNTDPGSPCMGVDLNRNYEANWGGPGASSSPCSESYGGTKVFSEPESQAHRDYLAPYINNGSLKSYLTFHSYGQYIIYPYAYDFTSVGPNKQEMDDLGAAMAGAIRDFSRMRYAMGQTSSTLYPAAGGSDDWCYDAMLNAGNDAPLSYTIELRDTGTFGFVLPANQIQPNCEEIDEAMDVHINYVMDNK